jgi:ornithine carbamoyltransferase
MKHFVSIEATSRAWLRQVLDVAKRLKSQRLRGGANDPILAGKTLAMIFEKPSLRTRVSFAVGMTHLGGASIVLSREEVGLGTREPVEDVARVLSGMCEGIMARVFEHGKIVKLSRHSSVPVINGLSDLSHPCQAMTDLMTIEEHFGSLDDKRLAYVGDGNNVALSLAEACARFGVRFVIASPPGYELSPAALKRLRTKTSEADVSVMADPIEAVKQADVLYTDTWVSMGQEAEKQKRIEDFRGFSIDLKLLKKAPRHAIVLHCLPAYRGLEISAEVMDHERSLVFKQAENRLHFQKGLLAVLLGGV